MKDVLRDPQPSGKEFFLVVFWSSVLTGLLIFTDISIHVNYVGQIISHCYPAQQDLFCTMMREFLNVPPDAQLQLGDAYWFVLVVQATVISLALVVTRIYLNYMVGEPFSPMVLFVGLLWGFTVYSFYLFGWIDWGYYALRGLPVDDPLPWLDGVGLFQYVQQYGATEHVDKSDLFLLMGIGSVLVILLWAVATHHQNKGTLQKWGLLHR